MFFQLLLNVSLLCIFTAAKDVSLLVFFYLKGRKKLLAQNEQHN
jgi:hypothetical protein